VIRLRIRFSRGQEIRFISHLDLIRVWHRALRRAGIRIAYSEGFNPHPRLALAAPLPLGVTSEAELMDIYIDDPLSPQALTARLAPELPEGLAILQAAGVGMGLPSLQAQIRFADYLVRAPALGEAEAREAIDRVLSLSTLPWEHQRDTGAKHYDLRPLINSLRLEGFAMGVAAIYMRLRCDSEGAGRPEQVVKALGLDIPLDIHRTNLVLETMA
jgi:radical SAM-linked protein